MIDPADGPGGRANVERAALADFLGSLSHDLRSPLGVVSQALAELRGGAPAGDRQTLARLTDRGIRRLTRLADTVGLASCLEEGPLDLRQQPLDLAELVREAVASASAIEPRTGVELACDVPGEHAFVGDAERLGLALTEIVINALRHARRRVRVALEATPEGARISVEDDGEGVPEDRRGALFRRFVPRKTRSGLGLGLSLAADVVSAYGGSIALEASALPPGRPNTTGARFVLTLASARFDATAAP